MDIKKTLVPSYKVLKELDSKICYTYVTSPNEEEKKTFYVHLLDNQKLNEDYERLHEVMQIHYIKSIPVNKVDVGGYYAAFIQFDEFMDFTGFYRVQVLNVTDDDGQVYVKYLDYGDERLVKLENMRELAPKFYKLPQRAIACQISGVDIHDQYKDDLFKSIRRFQYESFDDRILKVKFFSFDIEAPFQRVDIILKGLSLVQDYIDWDMGVPEEREERQRCFNCAVM